MIRTLTCLLVAFLVVGCSSQKTITPPISHALYIPAPLAHSEKISKVFELTRETGVNTLVVDIKDVAAGVSLSSAATVPLVTLNPDYGILDLKSLIPWARANNIWLVARIALFRDACLIKRKPEWALRKLDGSIYTDDGSSLCGPDGFASPYIDEVWSYNIELAKKAIDAGFNEVQLDYVRFPDKPRGSLLVPGEEPTSVRSDVIARGVKRVRDSLPHNIPLSADVFGYTVLGAEETIGQDIVKLAPHLEVLCPMLYPSLWSEGVFGIKSPAHEPYQIIKRSLEALDTLLKDQPYKPIIRPWYQEGEWPGLFYGRKEVQAQLQSAFDSGVPGWTLWNAEGSYDPKAIRGFPQ